MEVGERGLLVPEIDKDLVDRPATEVVVLFIIDVDSDGRVEKPRGFMIKGLADLEQAAELAVVVTGVADNVGNDLGLEHTGNELG